MNPSLVTYPLTDLQQAMLIAGKVGGRQGIYSVQCRIDFREALDPDCFRSAWIHLMERHEILRTTFSRDSRGAHRQTVHQNPELPWREMDWSRKSALEQEQEIESLADDEFTREYKENSPLFRIILVKRSRENFSLIWSSHHATIDGRSKLILLKELFTIYDSLCKGEVIDLAPASPFHKFVEWTHDRELDASLEFWARALGETEEPTILDLDDGTPLAKKPGRSSQSNVRIEFSDELTGMLRRLSKEKDITLNTLFQGAWAILLERYSGQSQVVFGATRAGRASLPPDLSAAVGPVITTVPVPVHVDVSMKTARFLQKLRRFWIDLRPHEHTPLSEIRQVTPLPSGAPLFESLFVFENYRLNDHLHSLGDQWTNRSFQVEGLTDFPLVINVTADENIQAKFDFDPERFSRNAIERLAGHFRVLLEGIASNPDGLIRDLPILTETEEHAILLDWNWPPPEKMVHVE